MPGPAAIREHAERRLVERAAVTEELAVSTRLSP
jgi:hypothetical protein